MDNPDEKLITFLIKTAEDIKNKTLPSKELQAVSELYIKNQFIKDMNKRGLNDDLSSKNQEEIPEEFPESEFMRFIILGWYCYSILNKA